MGRGRVSRGWGALSVELVQFHGDDDENQEGAECGLEMEDEAR